MSGPTWTEFLSRCKRLMRTLGCAAQQVEYLRKLAPVGEPDVLHKIQAMILSRPAQDLIHKQNAPEELLVAIEYLSDTKQITAMQSLELAVLLPPGDADILGFVANALANTNELPSSATLYYATVNGYPCTIIGALLDKNPGLVNSTQYPSGVLPDYDTPLGYTTLEHRTGGYEYKAHLDVLLQPRDGISCNLNQPVRFDGRAAHIVAHLLVGESGVPQADRLDMLRLIMARPEVRAARASYWHAAARKILELSNMTHDDVRTFFVELLNIFEFTPDEMAQVLPDIRISRDSCSLLLDYYSDHGTTGFESIADCLCKRRDASDRAHAAAAKVRENKLAGGKRKRAARDAEGVSKRRCG